MLATPPMDNQTSKNPTDTARFRAKRDPQDLVVFFALASALTIFFLFVYVLLIFRQNINWDEFNFLAQIYAVQSALDGPRLNNFHTLIYGWVTRVPGNEIDQIMAARFGQLAFFSGSMYLLYKIARQHFSGFVSLVVILLTVSYTDVLRHASSFRFDTIILFFSLLALYLYTAGSTRIRGAAAGGVLAIGFLVSIKAVFFLPVMLATAFIQEKAERRRGAIPGRILVLISSLGFAFAFIYLTRAAVGTETQMPQFGGEIRSVASAGKKMFLEDGLFPRSSYLARSINENIGHWVLLTVGALLALRAVFSSHKARRRALFVIACLIPLGSVTIYRNAFPYFYVLVIPPAMLSAGVAVEQIIRFSREFSPITRRLMVLSPIGAALLTASLFLTLEHREGISKQRTVLQSVHEIFPNAVPYLDGYGMVSSFPKTGLWMSTWGMDNYHRRNTGVMPQLLLESEPKFLLANHVALLDRRNKLSNDEIRYRRLLPEDAAMLTKYFVHHWGPIYIAGKTIVIPEAGQPQEFSIMSGGPYTVEAAEPIVLNEALVQPGQVVELKQGVNVLESLNPLTVVTLRWGDNLAMPISPAPTEWLWDGL